MKNQLTRKTCTPDQLACWEVLSMVFGGDHHLENISYVAQNGIKMNVYSGSMATFDNSYLTRLLFACHDACVRLQIVQGGPYRFGLMLHKRHKREGSLYERHPTIEQALADWRERHPAEEQA